MIQVYEPQIQALLGAASHFLGGLVPHEALLVRCPVVAPVFDLGIDRLRIQVMSLVGGPLSQPTQTQDTGYEPGGVTGLIFLPGVKDSGLVISTDFGRGTARTEDVQGTPTQSHISPSILVYEDKCTVLRSRVSGFELRVHDL